MSHCRHAVLNALVVLFVAAAGERDKNMLAIFVVVCFHASSWPRDGPPILPRVTRATTGRLRRRRLAAPTSVLSSARCLCPSSTISEFPCCCFAIAAVVDKLAIGPPLPESSLCFFARAPYPGGVAMKPLPGPCRLSSRWRQRLRCTPTLLSGCVPELTSSLSRSKLTLT